MFTRSRSRTRSLRWLLVQIATQVFPFFEIPNWAVRLVVLAIVIGFPIALVIAWAFELTPQGLKRTEDVDLAAQGQRKSHAWIYVVIVGAAFSIGLIFIGRYTAVILSSAARHSEAATGISQKSIGLKRRNVYKVAVAYVVAGWALAQGVAQVLPVFSVPNWVIQLLVVLIVMGLPVALGLAWAFELTPEGLKRTEEADAHARGARQRNTSGFMW